MNHPNAENGNEPAKMSLFEVASRAPEEAYENNRAVREAFDDELRVLAEEIVRHHPSLTQLLLSMGGDSDLGDPVHGRN